MAFSYSTSSSFSSNNTRTSSILSATSSTTTRSTTAGTGGGPHQHQVSTRTLSVFIMQVTSTTSSTVSPSHHHPQYHHQTSSPASHPPQPPSSSSADTTTGDTRALCRVDTWPNASTSYQDFRASRCNGCAAAGITSPGTTTAGNGTGMSGVYSGGEECEDCIDDPPVTSRLQTDPLPHHTMATMGGSQPINLDVLRSTPHHTCAGHYATADAQFKVDTILYLFTTFITVLDMS